MAIQNILKTAERFFVSNSPGILTGIGVAGSITTAILTGRATAKAVRIIDVELSICPDDDPNLSKREKFDLTWKEFIPPAISGVLSVTAIIAAHTAGSRRAGAFAAAMMVSEDLASEYRDKVKEVLGSQKEEKMRAELASSRIERNPGNTLMVVQGKVRVYDEYSDRFFESTVEEIRKAENQINFQINNSYYASLAQFYDKIGLAPTVISEQIGWNADTQLEVSITACICPDGVPAISISYNKEPIKGFDRLS